MTKCLVITAVMKLNLFPSRNGLSKCFSPHMLVTNEILDCERHFRFAHGEAVLVHNPKRPTNTQAARAILCVHLRPSPNGSGHDVHDISTESVLENCPQLQSTPITPTLINIVNATAERQGILSLKIQNEAKVTVCDSSWIAVVDFNNNEEDEDCTTDNDDNNKENDKEIDNALSIESNELDDLNDDGNDN